MIRKYFSQPATASSQQQPQMGSSSTAEEIFLIKQEWRLLRRIGAGSFGEIFVGQHVNSRDLVAVKLESVRQSQNQQLRGEWENLRRMEHKLGFPRLYWYGRDGEQNIYNSLVMELLGPSLEDLHQYCGTKFSIKTTLMLADQMLRRLQTLHECSLLHRDIKPDNFVMGTGRNCNQVYLIDLGLSKLYQDPLTKQHAAFKEFRNLTGTARYCSINAHSGYEQSRRDDLESLGYVLIYFLKGQLPWQGLPAESKREKFRKICRSKINTTVENLCHGLPEAFSKYLHFCRDMTYEEEPRYKYLLGLFLQTMHAKRLTYDCVFDWTPILGYKTTHS